MNDCSQRQRASRTQHAVLGVSVNRLPSKYSSPLYFLASGAKNPPRKKSIGWTAVEKESKDGPQTETPVIMVWCCTAQPLCLQTDMTSEFTVQIQMFCLHVRMYVRMYVCMYVCMSIMAPIALLIIPERREIFLPSGGLGSGCLIYTLGLLSPWDCTCDKGLYRYN